MCDEVLLRKRLRRYRIASYVLGSYPANWCFLHFVWIPWFWSDWSLRAATTVPGSKSHAGLAATAMALSPLTLPLEAIAVILGLVLQIIIKVSSAVAETL